MCIHQTAQKLAEGRLTILSTRFDHHVANGHALLHAHGCDGITGELHSLVGAACVPKVQSQYANLFASVVVLLGGLLMWAVDETVLGRRHASKAHHAGENDLKQATLSSLTQLCAVCCSTDAVMNDCMLQRCGVNTW